MIKRPHVVLNTREQKNDSVTMKYNYGFGDNKDNREADNDRMDYVDIGRNLRSSYVNFNRDRRQRINRRNLQVPVHVDFIRINFWGQFAVYDYFSRWYDNFGLEVVEVSNFGTSVLFALVDRNNDRLSEFLQAVESAIKNSEDHGARKYPKIIHYIQDFHLLTTADILKAPADASLYILRMADLRMRTEELEIILHELEAFLDRNEIVWHINREIGIIEIYGRESFDLSEIIDNFDVIVQVTSSRFTLIKPNLFNVPQREYGFTVAAVDTLPLVGVIDSGISIDTPLVPLIIQDESLNITATSVFEDNVDDGRGHGTAVAALVSLGAEAVNKQYEGVLVPHANLLPIKITDASTSFISITRVLEVLQEAKSRYPQIRVFTLTVNFEESKKYNEHYSNYAYALDKFSFENDCLIFISSGNNNNAIYSTNGYDLGYFHHEEANLCSPAESLNNVTVGACADSLSHGDYVGISNGPEYPTMYSRKGHYQYDLLKGKAKVNSTLFKPDLIIAGGDYCYQNGTLTDIGEGSLLLLSADRTESYYPGLGTSFSAPLAANIAVRIQKLYPSLKASSIKALMLNHCSDKLVERLASNKSMLIGHGCLDRNKVLYSNSNTVNFIIEDSIDNGDLKVIPLYFPEYLATDDLGKRNGIVRVTATICYQFLPVKDSQLGYCPVLIAFGFFRNHEGDEILLKEKDNKSKLKSSMRLWSQNCRFKQKPNPFSNVQKVSFVVNVQELVDESGTFKLGIHCLTHPQLRPGEDIPYQKDNKFSIALTIEETLREGRATGKLYDEMLAINSIENISSVDLDQDLEAEA